MVEYCKAQVANLTGRGLHHSFRECCRKAWKDGYCKQHHPETAAAKKAKEDEKYRLWNQSTRTYAQEQIKKALVHMENGDHSIAEKILKHYLENWDK